MSESKPLRRFFRHGLLPQLFVFETVARLGSVTRAAEALHLAQPTVSVQLRKLAEALGVQLFEPHGRCLQLTAAGHALQESCAELSTCLERVDARLAPWRRPATERVMVAAEPEAKGPATRLAADFQARHPGVEITLHVAERAELLARCTKGVDDVYVLALDVDSLPVTQRWSVTHATGREMSPCAALFLREALLQQGGGESEHLDGAIARDEPPEVQTMDLVAAAPGAGGARGTRFAGRRMTQRSGRRVLR
jgi:DNA-binding transcriptional LysR family regulator